MLEFEILARGLYQPDQLIITYDPSLKMPTNPTITTPTTLATPTTVSHPHSNFVLPPVSMLTHLANDTPPAETSSTPFAPPLPTNPTLQEWMDHLWKQKIAIANEKGIPLFDAPLFRLVSAESLANGTLSLVLGDTSYKEYVTTRVPEFFTGRTRQELGNALSVCSVVETSDGYILLDKRQGVDMYVGRYHVIGGFFERERDMAAQPDPFRAIRREIREETGIQASDIQEQYCLGVVYDVATPHGEICFLTRLNIPLAEVHTRIPEEDEIKQLHSLQVTKESLRNFILENHGNISATGEPNLLMYGAVRFGERWFEDMMGLLLTERLQ